MKNVYVFLATGFEEIEALTPVDILRRAGMDVRLVSVSGSETVKGARNIEVNFLIKKGGCKTTPSHVVTYKVIYIYM